MNNGLRLQKDAMFQVRFPRETTFAEMFKNNPDLQMLAEHMARLNIECGAGNIEMYIAAANRYKTGEKARRASKAAQDAAALMVMSARLLGLYKEE